MMKYLFICAVIGLFSATCVESRGTRTSRQAASSLVATACKKNPTLKFCPNSAPATRQADITSNIVDQVLSTAAPIPVTVPRLTAPPVPNTIRPVVVTVPPVVITAPPPPQLSQPEPVVQAVPEQSDHCKNFEKQFYHYCGNITEWDLELQAKLIEHCPVYAANCNAVATPAPFTFPPITNAPPVTLEPCKPGCKAPHCTQECICDYARPQARANCGADKKQAIAFFASNCEAFFKHCLGDYAPHGAYTPVPAEERDSFSKHNENPHTQFFTQPDSSHTDWLNGKVRGGSDFGVPAFGISGNAGEAEVSFPSLGSFIGRRRKRSTQIYGFEGFRPDLWVFE